MGMLGVQTYALVSATAVNPLPSFLRKPESVRSCLGLFGITTGLTAYVGCFAVAKPPRAGETVVVSAAAGAVGSIAAQLLKSTGATVIGVAGGPAKAKFLSAKPPDGLGL